MDDGGGDARRLFLDVEDLACKWADTLIFQHEVVLLHRAALVELVDVAETDALNLLLLLGDKEHAVFRRAVNGLVELLGERAEVLVQPQGRRGNQPRLARRREMADEASRARGGVLECAAGCLGDALKELVQLGLVVVVLHIEDGDAEVRTEIAELLGDVLHLFDDLALGGEIILVLLVLGVLPEGNILLQDDDLGVAAHLGQLCDGLLVEREDAVARPVEAAIVIEGIDIGADDEGEGQPDLHDHVDAKGAAVRGDTLDDAAPRTGGRERRRRRSIRARSGRSVLRRERCR